MSLLWAQTLSNWGEVIRTTPGTIVSVIGSTTNRASGLWYHSGALYVTDTMDNRAGNEHFRATFPSGAPVPPGRVELRGGYQWITGSDPIQFDTLLLRGTSSKNLAQDAYVRHWLDLEDRMLNTHAETLFHHHPDPGSIVRGTGFIRSSLGGALQRRCQAGVDYVFPLGDSLPVLRYRPVILRPRAAGDYNGRMANLDATSEGYDRSQRHPSFCLINPDYFHHLSGPARGWVAISFEPGVDPPYDAIAHWRGTQWDSLGGTLQSGTPLAYLTQDDVSLNPTPFALAIREPQVQILPDTALALCPGDSLRLFVANPNPNWAYTWSTGTSGPSTWVYGPGSVIVTVVAASGCTAGDTVTISALPAPFVAIQPASPQSLCPGDSLVLKASPALAYQWFHDSLPVVGAIQQTLTIWAPGTYWVQVIQVCGSAESSPFVLNYYPEPIAYFINIPSDSVELGQPVTFTDSSQGGSPVAWVIAGTALPGGPTLSHAFSQEGPHVVQLIVQNAFGCRDTFERVLYVRPFGGIYIPTAFTPNGDGLNEVFLIVAPPLASSRLRIYDRWGVLIREVTSQPPQWDGLTSSGQLVPEGVYTFVWEGQLFSGQTFRRSGTITVLR